MQKPFRYINSFYSLWNVFTDLYTRIVWNPEKEGEKSVQVLLPCSDKSLFLSQFHLKLFPSMTDIAWIRKRIKLQKYETIWKMLLTSGEGWIDLFSSCLLENNSDRKRLN